MSTYQTMEAMMTVEKVQAFTLVPWKSLANWQSHGLSILIGKSNSAAIIIKRCPGLVGESFIVAVV